MSKQSFRSIAVCLLGAAMCVSAAACGTSDDASSSGSETSAASPQAYDVSKIEKDEEIAALLPDSVKQDGVLTVGMDTSYAPAEFLAEDGKTPVGYDVDLSNALAKVLGLKADQQVSKFDLIIPAVGSKYDVGISSFTITPERMDAVDFVSFYKAGSTWVTKKGNPTNVDTADLCGVRVAVQTGTTQEEEVTQMSEDCTKNGKDAIDILSNALQTDVTTNVTTGKADVFYADSPVAGYAITQTDGQLEALGEDVGVTKQGIAVKKGDKQTAEALQKAMQKLMDSGVYEEILEQWGAQSGAVDKSEVNPTDVSQ
ncbi:ABC transporter substrate-binding protein [Bifidobacterium pseudolongum]|uniref:ABC transporter substrate-binding protein n=1 Tax=Bifidobacterium pseudolongum TaxID=1694 RepID=UPI001F0CFFA8|nr:ABC transporter substrate-binding protein [Bifidobacterium pseudolongum]MCH4859887.1 ABC transporter substrate-binding protein [Bifidobacterium pseudolongum]MCH4861658.1 ABC transporter substrate-binding protein [Bifidobacterium pseudolongum]